MKTTEELRWQLEQQGFNELLAKKTACYVHDFLITIKHQDAALYNAIKKLLIENL